VRQALGPNRQKGSPARRHACLRRRSHGHRRDSPDREHAAVLVLMADVTTGDEGGHRRTSRLRERGRFMNQLTVFRTDAVRHDRKMEGGQDLPDADQKEQRE
jgi:hypothetical protein